MFHGDYTHESLLEILFPWGVGRGENHRPETNSTGILSLLKRFVWFKYVVFLRIQVREVKSNTILVLIIINEILVRLIFITEKLYRQIVNINILTCKGRC